MRITAKIRGDGSGVLKATFKNFSTLSKETGVAQITPTVMLGKYCWQIHLFPGGNAAKDSGKISCFLHNKNSSNVTAKAIISLVDADGNLQKSKTIDSEIQSDAGYGFFDLIQLESITANGNRFLINDKLRINIQILKVNGRAAVETGCLDESSCVHFQRMPASIPNGGLDILPADVHICADRSENESSLKRQRCEGIPAHKFMLALHSPVFRAMVNAPMQEAATSTIEISDFAEPVVREFVQFLYTDRCAKSALHEHAPQLLAMADKYQVPALTAVCEHYLIGSLSEENAVQLLGLAGDCGATELKTAALSFVRANVKTMLEKGCFEEVVGIRIVIVGNFR